MRITVTPKNVRSLLESLGQIVLPDKIRADDLTDEQLTAIAGLFDSWRPGESVEAGWIRNFNGQLYECLQAHTTQSDWQPPEVPALWVVKQAPGVIAAWVQPTGAHDAYSVDTEVTHNGATWKSLVAANVWEPGTNATLWEEVV